MKKIVYIAFLAIIISSCSEYQKAIKSDDVGVKYPVATKLYEAGKYSKAIKLFEQIAPVYKGKPQAEKLFYMYAQSLYKTKQLYTAGYQFEVFASSYPKSQYIEEASFLSAKCYSALSPRYSLDQVDTDKAITKLQDFIDTYPNSTYLPEANTLVKELRGKLEKKAFEIAKQYNTISDYKAALVALDNFINDYPGTPYKEDALYYKLNSAYQLAINSVPSKMEQRLNEAKSSYSSLLKSKPETKYKKQADEMLAKIDKELQQFSK
jgi:outer membrane protein assembly factor BamD